MPSLMPIGVYIDKKELISNKELIVLRNLKIILPKFLTAAVEKKKSMKYLEKKLSSKYNQLIKRSEN